MIPPQLLSELKSLLGSSMLKSSFPLGGLLGKMLGCRGFSNRADDISEMILAKINASNEKSFRELLFEFIDLSGRTDPDIYKRAGCSRQLFHKIKNQENYHASKELVMAFCLALELEKDDVDRLLQSAGYALSKSNHRDLAFAFCIDKGIYDIMEVNEVFEAIGKKPLRYTD
jgi:hypothetical protein